MKIFLISTLFFFCLTISSGQTKETNDYFPVEQITYIDCIDSKDSNKCLSNLIGQKITHELYTIAATTKSYRDTLKIKVRFNVALDGKIIKENIWTSINDSIIRNKIADSIKKSINRLSSFTIKN